MDQSRWQSCLTMILGNDRGIFETLIKVILNCKWDLPIQIEADTTHQGEQCIDLWETSQLHIAPQECLLQSDWECHQVFECTHQITNHIMHMDQQYDCRHC